MESRFHTRSKQWSEFQKLAIGLLGLTHPEMVIARAKAAQKVRHGDRGRRRSWLRSISRSAAAANRAEHESVDSFSPRSRSVQRTVPLADNSQLNRDLGARAATIYGADED